jgi:uncharacterized protein YqgC (DUF456 family)
MNTKRTLITVLILLFLATLFGSMLWCGVALNGAPNAENLGKWGEFGNLIGGLIGPLADLPGIKTPFTDGKEETRKV